ncbi:MAG: hypothetical protein O7E52_25290, partial [Candidatus Poribacteria bacterium]|nr:hypothetical protein [Candidatus Poribacteria bacterium]
MQRRLHRRQFRPTLWFCIVGSLLLNAPIISAQIQRQFGQELLQQETAEPDAFESELTIDYQASNTFNDHVEFGLSIDPNT